MVANMSDPTGILTFVLAVWMSLSIFCNRTMNKELGQKVFHWKRPSSALSNSAGFAATNSCAAMPYETNHTRKNVWEPVHLFATVKMKFNGIRIPDLWPLAEFQTLQKHSTRSGVQSEPFPACMTSHPDLKTKTHCFNMTTLCIYVSKNEKTNPTVTAAVDETVLFCINLSATWLN